MKSVSLRALPELHIPICCSNSPSCVRVKPMKLVVVSSSYRKKRMKVATSVRERKTSLGLEKNEKGIWDWNGIVTVGAVCVGILAVALSEEKAMALGPEGPLVEEFWDNVRRYGLYALTVSTGALYTILSPILQLLKNPISAIFILALFGASFYIVSQVLSAMVGVSEFSYDYGY